MLSSSYARLPAHFFARLDPAHVANPRLIRFNRALAADLGLETASLGEDALAELYSGNRLPPGVEPIAMAYAGHQFGQFVPQLGDGRAILLGEARDSKGVLHDIQLKGSGRTPFSRGGDGRAALGPVLREYLVSEAMNALGIPATRALAAVSTGEPVFRDGAVPGAILTRVAASHVRVGTFQFFAARGDAGATRVLADYVIERHYPLIRGAGQPYLELLRAVMEAQAVLVAKWMQVGFIHGVMNTDNMAVSGQTIDFGPCAFMDAYDPATVFSSIDRHGRYAYSNQPHAAQWNLARFAETLLPLLDANAERGVQMASEIISQFPIRFADHYLSGMRQKLGLFSAADEDAGLIQGLLEIMRQNHADFTLTFRALSDAAESGAGMDAVRALLANPSALDAWAGAWMSRLGGEALDAPARARAMRSVNPLFIPRNHRIEEIITAAVEREDFEPFERLLGVLSRPFEDQAGMSHYSVPPSETERVLQTFCGT